MPPRPWRPRAPRRECSERERSQADTLADSAAARRLRAEAAELATEAAAHYQALLERADLSADLYVELAAGLWQAGAESDAVRAFRRALEVSPYHPTALELLTHALFQTARYDSAAALGALLVERYPYHRENLALVAHAHRQRNEPQKALELLERRERLPFEILNLTFQSRDSVHLATGEIANLKLDPGAPIEVEFQFRGERGEVVATASLSTQAPGPGARTPFQVSARSAAPVSGLTYRVVRPEPGAP